MQTGQKPPRPVLGKGNKNRRRGGHRGRTNHREKKKDPCRGPDGKRKKGGRIAKTAGRPKAPRNENRVKIKSTSKVRWVSKKGPQTTHDKLGGNGQGDV